MQMCDPKLDFICIRTFTSLYCNSFLELSNGILISGNASIFRIDPKEDFKCIKTFSSHRYIALTLLELPHRNIFSGSKDFSIKIWNCIKTLTDHTGSVNTLLNLPERRIASGSEDGSIKIWDCDKEFECIQTFSGNAIYVKLLISFRW